MSELPNIEPKDCPAKVVEWLDKRFDRFERKQAQRDDEMDQQIEKVVKRSINNRTAIQIMAILMLVLMFVTIRGC